MPSLIPQDGQVPSDSIIAANYRQNIVPFSRFGTRKVAWYKVGYADTKNNDEGIDQFKFNKIIDAIQTQAEIVMIGAPAIRDNFGKFMVAVFDDTAGNGSETDMSDEGEVGYNNNSSTIQEVLRAACDDNDMSFERFYLYGAPESGTDNNYGWSDSDTYQEYDTKAQFVDGYTQDC